MSKPHVRRSPRKYRKRDHLLLRDREVRDLYQKLMKKYRYGLVLAFLERNYFLKEDTVMQILQRVGAEPVNHQRCTITYKVAIRDDFNL